MAEIIRYVDTGSAGGNGTTSALSGANAAYASLSAWETAEDTALSGSGNWMHVYCAATGGAADTLAVTISGWTTSATEYILIEAASGHRASASGWDTSRYRLETANETALSIQEDYVRIDGLQIGKSSSDASEPVVSIPSGTITAENNLFYISNCRIRQAGNASYNERCISASDTNINIRIWNTICYGNGVYNDANNCLIYLRVTEAYLYNVTCRGPGSKGAGINVAAGTVTAKNCAVLDTADDWVGIIDCDYCASDDGGGTHEVAESGGGAGWPSDFTESSTGNFTLKTGSGLIDTGTASPAGVLFDDDIDGTTRGVAWDVGASEFVSSGTVIPALMLNMRRRRT